MLSQPLSFWGGVDAETGKIIDQSQPHRGDFAGKILVMPGGRGSSSSSSVLAETIRNGTAPAGILMERPDPILAVGAIVADFLYDVRMPLVVCEIAGIVSGDRIDDRHGRTAGRSSGLELKASRSNLRNVFLEDHLQPRLVQFIGQAPDRMGQGC